MTKTGNTTTNKSNIVRLRTRTGAKRAIGADQLQQSGLQFDFGYQMPEQLNQPKTRSNEAATSDAGEARQRAIRDLSNFVARPENFSLFATGLDGKVAAQRSASERRAITAVIDHIISLGYVGTSGVGEAAEQFPEFKVGKSGNNYDVENGPSAAVLPEPVSMALIASEGKPDQVVLTDALGFRDMHVQARNAILMATINLARSFGVNMDSGPIMARLNAVLDEAEFTSPQKRAIRGRPVSVRLDHRVYEVPFENYAVDSNLS